MVEDAVHGIEAANRAGMKSVGLTGTATRDALAAAHLVVDSLRELSPATLRDADLSRPRVAELSPCELRAEARPLRPYCAEQPPNLPKLLPGNLTRP